MKRFTLGFVFALLVAFSFAGEAFAADLIKEGEDFTVSGTFAAPASDAGAGASGGSALVYTAAGSATANVTTTAETSKIVVRARAEKGSATNNPRMAVYVDGVQKLAMQPSFVSTYKDLEIVGPFAAGTHTIDVQGQYLNSGKKLYLDKVTMVGGDGGSTEPPPPPPTGSGLAISGNQFTLDGQPFDMTGIRTASGSQSQALTDKLISQLDTYKAHDVNTISVFYMGSLGGNSDPFQVDAAGNVTIEPDDAARMRQIIEAADARGMVVIVGIFYQRALWSDITTDARVVKAIDAVVDDLQAYDNIIINIANENNSTAYADKPGNMQSGSQIVQYIQQVNNRDPDRLVGGGGYNDTTNITIAKAQATDALLFDTGGYHADPEHSGAKYDKYRAAGVPDKPLVNVEMFGGYTYDASVQPTAGCYTATGKQLHYKDVDDARVRPGLSVFFHSSKWIQGGGAHYELGGSGTCNSTINSPGMGWWFTYVRDNG